MQPQSFANPVGWSIVLIGILLACTAALAPHFNAGYRLMVDVLLAGLLPYLVYAVAVPLLRNTMTTATGILLIAIHGTVVVTERFAENVDYSDATIYATPVILAIVLLPLAAVAMIKSATHKPAPQTAEPQDETG